MGANLFVNLLLMPPSLALGLCRLNKQLKNITAAIVGTSYDPHRDIVLVTGGASGLGKAIVQRFVAKQGTVVVLDVIVPGESEQIMGVQYYKCDVSDREQISAVQLLIQRDVGKVTVLINNAGITTGKSLLNLSYDEIEKTIQINLLSSFYTIKTFLPDMLRMKRGYVVTIGSVLGYLSPARLSAYGASKSGLLALHESLTYELGPPSLNHTGVKTLLLCPGQIKTGMFAGVRTPSTLLAPELDPKRVAATVVSALELGRKGEIQLPVYAKIVPVLRAFPWQLIEMTRGFSGMDKSTKVLK